MSIWVGIQVLRQWNRAPYRSTPATAKSRAAAVLRAARAEGLSRLAGATTPRRSSTRLQPSFQRPDHPRVREIDLQRGTHAAGFHPDGWLCPDARITGLPIEIPLSGSRKGMPAHTPSGGDPALAARRCRRAAGIWCAGVGLSGEWLMALDVATQGPSDHQHTKRGEEEGEYDSSE